MIPAVVIAIATLILSQQPSPGTVTVLTDAPYLVASADLKTWSVIGQPSDAQMVWDDGKWRLGFCVPWDITKRKGFFRVEWR